MKDILLYGIILILIFFIINKTKYSYNKNNILKKNKYDNTKHDKYKHLKGGKLIYNKNNKNNKNIINNINNKLFKSKPQIRIKPYILNIKFHTNYRDIITAVDNMLPVPKNIFNKINIPVKYSTGNYKESKEISSEFVNLLKNHINRLPHERNINTGWDEALPDPNIKSGWDKFTEKIGIPNSLYEPIAKNGNIYLIDIFNYEKYETEDEIKYSMIIILGKSLVDDQILIKLSVVKNKIYSNTLLQKIILEEINIMGYLSDYGDSNEPKNTREPFYAFNQMTKSDIINNHNILSELEKNFNSKMNIVQNMLGTTEPDTLIFKPELIKNKSNISRTIVDDMNSNYF